MDTNCKALRCILCGGTEYVDPKDSNHIFVSCVCTHGTTLQWNDVNLKRLGYFFRGLASQVAYAFSRFDFRWFKEGWRGK